ncbi:archaemetzincin [Luteolibacter arcticus]|uniref:Archaemetzincin n=1 Tax=Luteolibacter arcticus TaxID=1581411 RepID=A0ABT3GQE9_9BACT|nr:archaemetzincin [Luteolibacter arcticus]MCW1925740.1 archaemetzincin [Luteolibacter arcticus]
MRFPKIRPWVIPLLIAGVAVGEFKVFTKEQRHAAAGTLSGLKPPLRRAFSDAGQFEAKKKPTGIDWLGVHEEPGQTFDQYLASRPNIPGSVRKKLYVLPIGSFAKGVAPDLQKLKAYTAAYFHPMPVEMLPVVPDAAVPAKERVNPGTGKKQWLSPDILEWLPGKLPADAYAMIAVTMTDLYPDEQWNFVFGQASFKERVGVFSFARYHPSWAGEAVGDGTETLVLGRAAKVLTHEMGHMFGIRHCIHYECNMNGVNHLAEADAAPMHLCPVCLRKVYHAIRFDPVERYEALSKFYGANRLDAEETWVDKEAAAIREVR